MPIENLVPNPGEHAFSVGQTGTGKSELAMRWLPVTGFLAIIDAKCEFAFRDCELYRDPYQIFNRKPKRFIYQPSAKFLADQNGYNLVYRMVWERTEQLFKRKAHPGTLYTDELALITTAISYPSFMGVCYKQGRSKGLSCIVTTQRPSGIPIFTMSEARVRAAFKLNEPADIRRVRAYIKGYDPELLPDDHTFWFHRQGEASPSRKRLTIPGKEGI